MRIMPGLFAVTLFASALQAQTLTSTAADRRAVSVTIYNDDRGLVREERAVVLTAGATQLRFMDVAEKIDATTVHVRVREGAAIEVAEQDYEFDLLTPAKLLQAYVGQTVTLTRDRLKGDAVVEERVPAKLLADNEGAIWEIDGKIVSNPGYDRLEFPSLPGGLSVRPTLVWMLGAAAAGPRRIEAAYLTKGMKWHADYVVALEADERTAALSGWVTLTNESGATFENAQIKVVAGDVHRATHPGVPNANYAAMQYERAVATTMMEEGLFEFHLYTLPRPTTLKQKQTKQVQLVDAPSFAVGKQYLLRGGANWRDIWRSGPQKESVGVFLTFRNSAASGLRIALPKGTVRVYKRDAAGAAQFIGEDAIGHTPRDEDVRVEMGNAFDIAVERKQTDFKRIASDVLESAWEIRLRNHKEGPVTVSVVEPVGGDWTLLESSVPGTKTAAFQLQFEVPVAKDAEAVLTYRVRSRY